MNPFRLAAASVVVALVVSACTAQPPASPSPSPSIPATPSVPAEPSPTPIGTRQPTVGFEPATVPDSMVGSASLRIVPGGEGLVAIGFDGQFGSILWTSPDGRTWSDVTPDGFASVGIAGVTELGRTLVGVGRGDTINVDAEVAAAYLSDDGVTWRQAAGGADMRGQLIDVASTTDGLYAVGGVPGADAAGVWHSTDGETWQRTGGDFEHAFMWAVAEGGPGLVAVGWRRNPDPDLAVWTSPDGVEWERSPDPEGFAGYEATDVIDLDGTLVMVGSSFTGDRGQIWYSGDGVTWELAEVADGMDGAYARTVTRTPAGLVAVGGNDAMEGMAWLSTDGRAWEQLGEPVPNAFFTGAYAATDGLLLTGATQTGTMETGIESHAMIWTTAVD